MRKECLYALCGLMLLSGSLSAYAGGKLVRSGEGSLSEGPVRGTAMVVRDARADSASVTDCDRLAGSPVDPQKVAPGVPYDQVDVAQALPACEMAVAADPTNARLQFQYGRALNVAEQYADAAVWYRKAADQNHAVAQTNLGLLYQYGDGVAQDYAQAIGWYEKAAAQGMSLSMFNLGLLYDVDLKEYDKAAPWYLKAAELGDSWAQNSLGVLYENGQGVEKDLAKAFSWYGKAAAQGDEYGLLNVGACHHNGYGTERNETAALEQWRKARDQGSTLAQAELVFSWAEMKYPNFFPGFARSAGDPLPAPYDQYSYRTWTATAGRVYLAMNPENGRLYYQGPESGFNVLDLGLLDDWAKLASQDGY